MSKILQSLPLTITAGVVLTIVLVFVTDAITSSPPAPTSVEVPADHNTVVE